jgi:signal transduction histidine kinase
MDEVVWLVNSRRDTLRDFVTYVCKHTQRFLDSTAIRCRLDVEASLPDATFEMPVRRNLLLAVREALNNAAKYSGAIELFLRIQIRGQSLLVVVEDQGKGFDLDAVDALRNGLTNMSERMKEIGGRFQITTAPGQGCRIEFLVPFSKSSKFVGRSRVQEELPLTGLKEEEGVPR